MAIWLKENNKDKAIKIILFIISPLFSFVYSLSSIKTRSSYFVFFLFAIFFGMAFTVGDGNLVTEGFDGYSYRKEFEQYRFEDYSRFISDFQGFLGFSEGKKDFYFNTVAYYLSRITDNYHVMFMVFSIIFAFFMLKSLKFLTAEENFNYSISCLILTYLFTINQIFNINGVRMWTAGWVAVYAIFQIFRNNNKIYFILLLLTPYIHASYWILIIVVILGYLFMRFEKVWIVLFMVSFFVGAVSLELLQNATDKLPVFAQYMISAYTDNEYVKSRNEVGTGFDWVSRLFNILVNSYINIATFLFVKNSKDIKSNRKTKRLYLFLLVYMTFVNFTMAIPSLGGRYILLAYPLIAYIWLVNFKDKKYKIFLYVMPIVFLFSFYSMISLYITVLDISFYFSNPLYMIYKYLIA